MKEYYKKVLYPSLMLLALAFIMIMFGFISGKDPLDDWSNILIYLWLPFNIVFLIMTKKKTVSKLITFLESEATVLDYKGLGLVEKIIPVVPHEHIGERLRLVLEQSPLTICYVSPNNQIIKVREPFRFLWNNNAAALFINEDKITLVAFPFSLRKKNKPEHLVEELEGLIATVGG